MPYGGVETHTPNRKMESNNEVVEVHRKMNGVLKTERKTEELEQEKKNWCEQTIKVQDIPYQIMLLFLFCDLPFHQFFPVHVANLHICL